MVERPQEAPRDCGAAALHGEAPLGTEPLGWKPAIASCLGMIPSVFNASESLQSHPLARLVSYVGKSTLEVASIINQSRAALLQGRAGLGESFTSGKQSQAATPS